MYVHSSTSSSTRMCPRCIQQHTHVHSHTYMCACVCTYINVCAESHAGGTETEESGSTPDRGGLQQNDSSPFSCVFIHSVSQDKRGFAIRKYSLNFNGSQPKITQLMASAPIFVSLEPTRTEQATTWDVAGRCAGEKRGHG